MTQTVGVLQEHEETLSQRAARRLRGCLAENRISQTDLARVLHMPQQKVSRKVNGQTPLTLDEIQVVSDALGVPLEAVLGVGDYADRGIGLCSIRGGRSAAGGGSMFLPAAEVGAPSGTRTPNPLIRRQERHLHVVGRIPLGEPIPVRPRPAMPSRRHLVLIGGAA